jgi:hypothetical protein
VEYLIGGSCLKILSSPKEELDPVLQPQDVGCREDESSLGLQRRPQIPEECVVIEDMLDDVEGQNGPIFFGEGALLEVVDEELAVRIILLGLLNRPLTDVTALGPEAFSEEIIHVISLGTAYVPEGTLTKGRRSRRRRGELRGTSFLSGTPSTYRS